MYGTLVRMRPKAGNQDALVALLRGHEPDEVIDGFVVEYLLTPDAGSDELVGLIVFSSREAYWKNARSPEQDQRYQVFRSLLAEDPVWLDGEILAAEPASVSL
jgi:hypothetical protein